MICKSGNTWPEGGGGGREKSGEKKEKKQQCTYCHSAPRSPRPLAEAAALGLKKPSEAPTYFPIGGMYLPKEFVGSSPRLPPPPSLSLSASFSPLYSCDYYATIE